MWRSCVQNLLTILYLRYDLYYKQPRLIKFINTVQYRPPWGGSRLQDKIQISTIKLFTIPA